MNITTLLIYLHAASGMTALTAGTVAMISRKGNDVHKKSGRIFYFAMMMVCVTGIAVSLMKSTWFLLMLGIFSGFQAYCGYRAIQNKSLRYSNVDKIVLVINWINTLVMIATMKLVLVVFGIISLLLSIGQTQLWKSSAQQKTLPPKLWLRQHIGMMIGAYIAAFTAFLVVNITFLQPAWVLWLAPTAVFVPLLIYWTRKWTN
jgi:uncharacterized membrane protein